MIELHKMMNIKHKFKINRLHKALFGMLVVVCAAAPEAVYAKKHRQPAAQTESTPVAPVEAVVAENPDEISHYSYTLEEMGELRPLELRSVNGQRSVTFAVRNDEVITAAKLKLAYAWSPSLIPELSHLKVKLNDELMSSLPLNKENSNGHVSDVKLDANMFIDFNKLTLEMIAHYTRECEDPMHSTLWSNISNQSRLDLTVRHLKLPNDLSFLPAPFFDKLDNRKLVLPIVFAAEPGNDVLQVAGVVASWFGSLASYRGAEFPVLHNTLPKGNGVLMVAGSAAPAGLNLPAINGASLAVVTNPLNATAKLLVVMGRDAKELELAAHALMLGKPTLNGSFVNVTQVADIPLRKPYDAPNWVPTDRPVHIGELAKHPELQVEGVTPDLIRVNFNLPPDLFPWRSAGIPLNLRYRYTIRPVQDRSTLNVNINGQFVKSLPLQSMPSKLDKKIKLPFMEDGKAIGNEVVLLPHDKVFGQNQMQFHYFFDYIKQGACKDVFLNNERGAIDTDTTIDFSSFPHYTAMPNLGYFANDGYPYTRMADLSETAVVMPDKVSTPEMETYLAVMGRMGRVTGYPAVRHVLISAANVEANANKDLILIGAAGNQPLLERWADKMHPLLADGSHTLKLPGPFERLRSRWENRDLEDAMHRAGDLITKGDGGLGALVGFQSPLKSGRSVVVFTGDNPQQIAALATSMGDPKKLAVFHGDLVMQSGKRIESFQVGPTYFTGKLPWWTALHWYLSNQPLILLVLIGLAALLVAVMSFRYLRNLAAKRLAK